MRKWEAHRNYTQYAEEFKLLKTRAHKNGRLEYSSRPFLCALAKTNNKKRQEQDYTNGINVHLSVFATWVQRLNAYLSVFAQHCTSGIKHSAGVVEFVPISFWNGTWTQQSHSSINIQTYYIL